MDPKELKPVFLDLRNPENRETKEKLIAKGARYVDSMNEALEDLFRINFPYVDKTEKEYKPTMDEYLKTEWNEQMMIEKTNIVYIPWKNCLVRIPNHELFFKLRTSRNHFLITEEEQDKFYNSTIGIAGLSIGSSVLNSIVLSGGSNTIHIADNDILSITNMNRLPSSICDLESSKLDIAQKKIYELNPYQQFKTFPEGVNKENLDRFLSSEGKNIALFIEEMDNVRFKILSRFRARELGIPVIMSTDNGDNVIIDVERFDLEPNRPLFHGAVDEELLSKADESPTMNEKVRLASAIVGNDVTPRAQESLMAVGSELASWPQLGNAATLSGVAISYVARRIILGEEMPSGRYVIDIDSCLDVNYNTPESIRYREEKKQEFIDGFDLIFSEDKNE